MSLENDTSLGLDSIDDYFLKSDSFFKDLESNLDKQSQDEIYCDFSTDIISGLQSDLGWPNDFMDIDSIFSGDSPDSDSSDNTSVDKTQSPLYETPPISPPESNSSFEENQKTTDITLSNILNFQNNNLNDISIENNQSKTSSKTPKKLILNGKVYNIICNGNINENTKIKIVNKQESKALLVKKEIQKIPQVINLPQATLDTPTKIILSPQTPFLSSQKNIKVPIVRNTKKIIEHKELKTCVPKEPILLSPTSHQIDLKALKKHERMIKNRASACLSRKRKKEYVVALEKQINDLTNENTKLKAENISLRRMIEDFGLPTKKTLFEGVNITKNSKNTAFLLAMILMVSINVGSFGSYITKKIQHSQSSSILNEPKPFHTRSLLWESSINETVSNLNESFKLSLDEQLLLHQTNKFNISNLCSQNYNQSESLRLDAELRKWIGASEIYQNKSLIKKSKLSDPTNKLLNLIEPFKSKFLRWFNRKKQIFENKLKHSAAQSKFVNDIQLYNFDYFEEFFKEINRQDDTFYIVSFNIKNQKLFPAIYHNKTTRPKMSFLIPTVLNNDSFTKIRNDHIQLLKIDCEVINTDLVSIKENILPKEFSQQNPNIFKNLTKKAKNTDNKTDLYNELLPDFETTNLFEFDKIQTNSSRINQNDIVHLFANTKLTNVTDFDFIVNNNKNFTNGLSSNNAMRKKLFIKKPTNRSIENDINTFVDGNKQLIKNDSITKDNLSNYEPYFLKKLNRFNN